MKIAEEGIYDLGNGMPQQGATVTTINNDDKATELNSTPKTDIGVTQDDENKTNVIEDNDEKNAADKAKELEAKQSSKIVLDGPLSQVYTQALNLAYAKEDTGTILADLYNQKKNDKINAENAEREGEVDKTLYVYCADGEDIEQEEALVATDSIKAAIDSGKYQEAILAIECGHTVSRRIGLMSELAASFGAKVCITRNSALRAVQVAVESFKK